MTTDTLLPRTQKLLDEAVPAENDLDAKLRRLIEAEYLRELARYRRTDLAISRKYDLSFDQFVA